MSSNESIPRVPKYRRHKPTGQAVVSPSSEFCLLEFPVETPGSVVHRESCAAECRRGMLVYRKSTERILLSTR